MTVHFIFHQALLLTVKNRVIVRVCALLRVGMAPTVTASPALPADFLTKIGLAVGNADSSDLHKAE